MDASLVEMAKFYGASGKKIVTEVYIPSIIPFIISGISSATGIGWRAIIVGEVLAQPTYGIGTVMQSAQTFLNVDILIAWIVIGNQYVRASPFCDIIHQRKHSFLNGLIRYKK